MINMTWKDEIRKKDGEWPKHIKKDGKRHSLFKVIGKKGTYRNPDVEKDLHLTVEEANKLTYSKASSGGFARQYKGNDPRSRLNKQSGNFKYTVREKLDDLIEELAKTQEAKDEAASISDADKLLMPEISIITNLMQYIQELDREKFEVYRSIEQPDSEEYYD